MLSFLRVAPLMMKVSFGPEMCRDFAHRKMLNFGGSKKPAKKKNDQPKKNHWFLFVGRGSHIPSYHSIFFNTAAIEILCFYMFV